MSIKMQKLNDITSKQVDKLLNLQFGYCVIQVEGYNVNIVEIFLNKEDAQERIYDLVFALEHMYGKVICVAQDKSIYRVLNHDIWLYLWGGVPIK